MSNTSANLALPYMAAAQAQKHITHNEALERLDALAQLSVVAFDATLPPTTANNGEVWAIGAGVGAWAGHAGDLAIWSNGGWIFARPKAGWRAAFGPEVRVFDGLGWGGPVLQNIARLGVGTGADATNPLAVAGDATLLTHAGGGHQVKVNKAATGDTASLLFQTGFSGRVEMGTAGTDDFAIKTSADGVVWGAAITAYGASGRIALGGPVEVPNGTGAAPAYSFGGDLDTGMYRAGANVLGFAAGGAPRARVTTAGLEVTGAISGSAVQAQPVDVTAGRLMAVGAFGLGSSDLPEVVNPDTIAATGHYRVAGAAAMPTTGIFAVQHVQRASGSAVQTAWLLAAPARLFMRHYAAGSWTGWRGYNETLGAVSQVAGVATGAVIESGSNENGDYVRFADGTQICRCKLTAVAITTGVAGLFQSAAQSWTFPVAFVMGATDGATLQGRVSNAAGLSVNAPGAGLTTEATGIRAFATASLAASDIYLIAHGRWY
jgi:hypothetical protein